MVVLESVFAQFYGYLVMNAREIPFPLLFCNFLVSYSIIYFAQQLEVREKWTILPDLF